MKEMLDDVFDCHEKFGLLTGGDAPGHLTRRKLKERCECLQEELTEFEVACHDQALEKQVDALIDLIYFALGTLVMLGVRSYVFKWLWNDVHRANMAKQRGTSHRGHQVDLIKPLGWVPPQGHRLLVEAGYAGYLGEAEAHDDNHS